MQVSAKGQLRHCFFGTYSAVVVLQFNSIEDARDALKKLGNLWRTSEKEPNILVANFSGEELDSFKKSWNPKAHPCNRKSCRDGCKDAEIDNVNHSIDYGPPFDITIDVTPEEQTSLF